MTDYNNIDDQFRDQAKDWEGQPGDAAWNRLTNRLDEHHEIKLAGLKRRRMIYRWSAAASVAILMALSIYMFNNSFEASGFHAEHTKMEVPEHAGIQTDQAGSIAATGAEADVEEAGMSASRITSGGRTERPLPEEDLEITESKGGFAEIAAFADEAILEEVVIDLASDADLNESAGEVQQADAVTYYNADGAAGRNIEQQELTDDQEIEALTETAVANYIGIEAQKAEHERSENKGKARKKESISTAAAYDIESKDKRDQGIEGYVEAGDRAEDYISTTITVLVPYEKKNSCRYVAFQIDDDVYYIDRCQNDRFDLLKSESFPLQRSAELSALIQYDREYLQSLENQTRTGPCLPSARSALIIFRTGTALSYYEETIRLPLQEFCLPEEAIGLIRDLKKLRDRYLE